jgi:hypothetical protein
MYEQLLFVILSRGLATLTTTWAAAVAELKRGKSSDLGDSDGDIDDVVISSPRGGALLVRDNIAAAAFTDVVSAPIGVEGGSL